MFLTPEQKKISKEQVNEICENLWKERIETSDSTCPDCEVKPGEYHLDGCDVALCSCCGEQRLQCGCEEGNTTWDGILPGIKECYEQKLICYDESFKQWRFDLNMLARKNFK